MNKAFITLLWIASALLTYWLGLEQGAEPSYTGVHGKQASYIPPPVPQKKKIEQQVSGELSPSDSLSSEPRSGEVPQADPVRDQEIMVETQSSDLQERIKSSNPVIRLRAFIELLEDGSPQSIEKARGIYEKLPDGPQRFSELRMLAYSWGAIRPTGCSRMVQETGGI